VKRLAWLATVLIISCTVVGCKSGKSVARVFQADMDTTWAAVVRAAEKATSNKPITLDREKGKIVTGLAFGDVRRQQNSDYQYQEQQVDVWRATLELKPEGKGTKVTVKLQKGDLSVADDPRVLGRKEPGIGVVWWSNNTQWQDKFLEMVEEELSAPLTGSEQVLE